MEIKKVAVFHGTEMFGEPYCHFFVLIIFMLKKNPLSYIWHIYKSGEYILLFEIRQIYVTKTNRSTYTCHRLKIWQVYATEEMKNVWREENTHLYLVGRVVRGQKRFTRLYAGRRRADLNIWTSKPLSGGRSGVTGACSRRILQNLFKNLVRN